MPIAAVNILVGNGKRPMFLAVSGLNSLTPISADQAYVLGALEIESLSDANELRG